jgi:hypothetical protein
VEPDLSKEELRAVARRPAGGSIKNFLRDLKDLASFRALKATVQEFQRDDALGLAAQLAYYLILALFPFILVLVSLMGLRHHRDLHRQHHQRTGRRAGAVHLRYPLHDLGRLRRLRRPNERPQPGL